MLTRDEIVEVEFPGHARLIRQVVGAGKPAGGAARPPHRNPRPRTIRVIALGHIETAEVEAVIGVQVREHDSVNVFEGDVLLQRAERSVSQVEDEPESLVLDEVARCRRVRSGKRTGAADHREAHCSSLGALDDADLRTEEARAEGREV